MKRCPDPEEGPKVFDKNNPTDGEFKKYLEGCESQAKNDCDKINNKVLSNLKEGKPNLNLFKNNISFI